MKYPNEETFMDGSWINSSDPLLYKARVEWGYRMGYIKQKPIIVGNKIGRNDPCPCGSNKKFKKCCGGII